MDYKEKYEQALSKARQFSENPLLEDSANIVEYIFPELAESEDEKIRKALIDYFDDANKVDENPLQNYGIQSDKVIAWLKKQGQVKESVISQHENKTCKENDDSLTSEDEMIRKEIRDFICWATDRGCITKEQMEKSNSWLAWLNKQCETTSTEDFGEFINILSKQFPEVSFAKLSRIAVRVKKWLEKQASPVLSNSSNVGKNAWSEEDEENLKLIKFAVLNLSSQREDTRQECLAWLESLKDRVQPTIAWNENDEVALESAATNYAQDKYLPFQTAQAFKAGARWVLTSLTTSSPAGQAPT